MKGQYLVLTLLLGSLFSFSSVLADDKGCFPISRATHDNHCFSIDNKKECQDTKDIYSCAWGISKEEERIPHADEQRDCEDSRCSEQVDYEEDIRN